VVAAVVGWLLFDGADPALWTEGYWPVRELLPAAIAFSIGGAVLLRYRKARWPAGVLLICGLLAGLAMLFAGLWWDAMLVYGPLAQPMLLANGIATDLLLGLSLTVLPQLYPDGWRPWLPAQGRRAGRHHPGDRRRKRGTGDLRPEHRRASDRRDRNPSGRPSVSRPHRARVQDLGPARARASQQRDLSPDGHQHQDSAE
jgi:hypothetical protein